MLDKTSTRMLELLYNTLYIDLGAKFNSDASYNERVETRFVTARKRMAWLKTLWRS